MTIDELLASVGLTANDEIPLWDAEETEGEPTKKITAANFATAIKALGSLLSESDVVNNLTNNDPNPVSSGGMYTALYSNTYSNSGLTFTGCSRVTGGYTQIGNLVIANLRIGSITVPNIKISGFPTYTNKTTNGKNLVALSIANSTTTGTSGVEGYLGADGNLYAYGLNSSYEYILSAVYIRDI